MRPSEIDRSGAVWTYRPGQHKTAHHGHARTIFIGPKARAILLPFLDAAGDDDAPVFCPAAAAEEQRHARTAKRVTPASCGNRPGTNRKAEPKRKPGRAYTVATYRRAITRGCEAAGVAPFAPNQLRHLAATVIRREHGLEAAQVILGHSKADITQVYAERDAAAAVRVVSSIG